MLSGRVPQTVDIAYSARSPFYHELATEGVEAESSTTSGTAVLVWGSEVPLGSLSAFDRMYR